MKINWTVRAKNKNFWMAFVPAVLLLAQAIASLCGFELDLTALQTKILAVIDAVFLVLATMGVVVDPTTEGIGDSQRAMGYTIPYPTETTEETNPANE